MHDTLIKNYCIWARRELMTEVKRRCALYDIAAQPHNPKNTEAVNGRVLSRTERNQRRVLIDQMQANGEEAVIEKAAYTWFNRIMAMRFMGVNDHLPSHTRILSSNDNAFRPQVLTEALHVDIEGIDRAKVAELVREGDDEATFRYLFLAQCNELAQCMPDVFEPVGSAFELLLPDGLLRSDGVISRMVEDIPEEDWREGVEIVGWMYQYYVSERKDEYFAAKRKATREDLAPATQLFTPEWIVRYLTQNSLGRLWMLNHPESNLESQMEYFIAPEDGAETESRKVDSPEEITVVDPACGSGHILAYAFDLLAKIYEEQGYSRRDIPQLILQNNIYGLEIDPRAAAMASFALTMKACELDSRFLGRNVSPNITVLNRIEFTEEEREAIAHIAKEQESLDAPFLLTDTELMDVLEHLDEAGSLFAPTEANLNSIREALDRMGGQDLLHHSESTESKLKAALEELEPLARHYDAVIANPPYLGSGSLAKWESEWLKKNYHDGKADLFAAFIYRGFTLAKADGYNAMVTMQSWMFLDSFENMRNYILNHKHVATMAHLGARAFDQISGEVVQTTAFVVENQAGSTIGIYLRLVDFDGEAGKSAAAREAIQNPYCGWFYRTNQQDFKKIPGTPIAYWASNAVLANFAKGIEFNSLSDFFKVAQGITTGDNNRFLRLWWEVGSDLSEYSHLPNQEDNYGLHWVAADKGGSFRKWYGNNDFVINWNNGGQEIIDSPDSTPRNLAASFQPSCSCSKISSGDISFRHHSGGFIFTDASVSLTGAGSFESYSQGFLNSSVCLAMMKILAPTLNFEVGQIRSLPFIIDVNYQKVVDTQVGDCRALSRTDWDSYETSWDFTELPLLKRQYCGELQQAYMQWMGECNKRFYQLKANEEELNRIFAGIYGMQDEVTIEVPLDKVSVHYVVDAMDDLPESWGSTSYVRTKRDEVVSLISYAVGCMMGRYSLDRPGLILANQGDGLDEYRDQVPNPTFQPDADGIIPLTDVEYFHDDATGLFVDFVRTAFGEACLEQNLRFVADALGGSGTPRQVIREYFHNDFFVDHCKTYSVQRAGKRPIYWLFDSGKKGGFRALFYMHRYTPDLLARLRTEYVHPQQERYRTQISHIDEAMSSADKREQAGLKKQRKKLSEQLAEITSYEEKVHHLADQMIKIDLGDGVKHNYALFQDVLAKIK